MCLNAPYFIIYSVQWINEAFMIYIVGDLYSIYCIVGAMVYDYN